MPEIWKSDVGSQKSEIKKDGWAMTYLSTDAPTVPGPISEAEGQIIVGKLKKKKWSTHCVVKKI